MYAAVDLGSNSFRLHIGTCEGEGIRIVKSAREPIRLGAGLDDKGRLTEQAMLSAIQCLARFATILAAYPLQEVRVVATNTIRIASNAAAFLPLAEQAIGYPIEVISGEEEGRLIYMGVSSVLGRPSERRLVVDIGGGSTELVLGRGPEIELVESFTIGTVPHNASFFGDGRIDAAAFDAAILSARSRFEDAARTYQPLGWSAAYGSSGTIRAIGEAIGKNGTGETAFSLARLQTLKARLIRCGDISRVTLAGVRPDRAGVIAGGLAILIGVMQELGITSMMPVDAGLRMGVLSDLHLRETRRDRRDQAVRDFARRFHADEGRAARVAEIAAALHALQKPQSEACARLLRWSALLHETGMAVSHSGYHKHGAYLVENADLVGFTTRDQRTMSLLLLGQKGNLRKLGDALTNPEFARAVLALRLAILFMHAGMENASAGVALKMKGRIELEIPRAWIDDHPTLEYWLEKEMQHWKEVGVEFSLKPAARALH